MLFFTALLNLLTKEVATIGGSAFTAVFLAVFMISERLHEKRLRRRRITSTSSNSTRQTADGNQSRRR